MPTLTPEPPAVRWVGVRDSNGEKQEEPKAYAERGDEIWVDVIKFKEWLNSLGDKKSEEWDQGILSFTSIMSRSMAFTHFTGMTGRIRSGRARRFPLNIRLRPSVFRWSAMRTRSQRGRTCSIKPGFNRKVVVSVGFDNGEEIRSQLAPDDKAFQKNLAQLREERRKIPPSDKDRLEQIDRQLRVAENGPIDQQFYLTIIPKFSTAIGLMVILGALMAFFALARHTHYYSRSGRGPPAGW